MLILLYNNAHIGDIFIGQQIITNIINCNPDKNIKFYCRYNHFIMSDVSRALFLPPPDVEQNLKAHLQNNNHFIFAQMPTPDLLMINFWVLALQYFTPNALLECNPYSIQEAVIEGLKKIKEHFGISINYDRLSKISLIPKIPFTQTNTFTLWKQQNTKKKLFYFNYLPKSGQAFPFSEPYEIHHQKIIENIVKTNPDLLVLVPSFSGIEHPNILDCGKLFNCVESVSCENIYELNQIASQCDYRIIYDVGACFTFFNSKFSESTCKTFHVSANLMYYPIFKNYLDSVNLNTENYINVLCHNTDDIIQYFQTVN